jgi:hypothetical protein
MDTTWFFHPFAKSPIMAFEDEKAVEKGNLNFLLFEEKSKWFYQW